MNSDAIRDRSPTPQTPTFPAVRLTPHLRSQKWHDFRIRRASPTFKSSSEGSGCFKFSSFVLPLAISASSFRNSFSPRSWARHSSSSLAERSIFTFTRLHTKKRAGSLPSMTAKYRSNDFLASSSLSTATASGRNIRHISCAPIIF